MNWLVFWSTIDCYCFPAPSGLSPAQCQQRGNRTAGQQTNKQTDKQTNSPVLILDLTLRYTDSWSWNVCKSNLKGSSSWDQDDSFHPESKFTDGCCYMWSKISPVDTVKSGYRDACEHVWTSALDFTEQLPSTTSNQIKHTNLPQMQFNSWPGCEYKGWNLLNNEMKILLLMSSSLDQSKYHFCQFSFLIPDLFCDHSETVDWDWFVEGSCGHLQVWRNTNDIRICTLALVSTDTMWFVVCLHNRAETEDWKKHSKCALFGLLSHDQLDWHSIFLAKIKMWDSRELTKKK